jgi:multisubunit Na+/H+ antiporter MnhB subunit
MRTIRSVDVKSFVIYGAILAAFWTLVYGLYLWILGWIFGAQSWWVDMNLGYWTVYTMTTLGLVIVRAFFAALGGALAGWIVALVYNLVAGMMGGVKLNMD